MATTRTYLSRWREHAALCHPGHPLNQSSADRIFHLQNIPKPVVLIEQVLVVLLEQAHLLLQPFLVLGSPKLEGSLTVSGVRICDRFHSAKPTPLYFALSGADVAPQTLSILAAIPRRI